MTNQQVFENYVNQFDTTDRRVRLKLAHTLRVATLARQLATSLELAADDLLLAEEIGLLHDIGRFEQIRQFATDKDAFNKDMVWDHADNGVRLLFDLNLIEEFSNIAADHWPIIKTAVKNHNKLAIEPNLGERELLHCQIIRDADKLDIFQALLDEAHERDFQPDLISAESRQRFFNRQTITQTDLELNSLRTLAFVFDVNFKFSFRHLRDQQLLTKLFKASPSQDRLQEYYQFAQDFVETQAA